jgi:hypothetical protein
MSVTAEIEEPDVEVPDRLADALVRAEGLMNRLYRRIADKLRRIEARSRESDRRDTSRAWSPGLISLSSMVRLVVVCRWSASVVRPAIHLPRCSQSRMSIGLALRPSAR